MRIQATGIDEAQQRLEEIAARLADLTPVMQVAVADTVTLIDDSFDGQRSPSGAPWAPRSEATDSIRLSLAIQGARFRVASRSEGDVSDDDLRKARRRAVRSQEKKNSNRKLLIDTGRLRQSITGRSGKTSFQFGTNVVYAATQQFGRSDNKVFGKHPGPIPARPFMPVEAESRGKFRLMNTGAAGQHWSRVRRMVAEYIRTGRLDG